MGVQGTIIEIRDKLKPIKELVAIIIFFVGGLAFAISYFVTKSAFDFEMENINAELLAANERLTEEVASLQCKLISHVNILSFHDAQNKVINLKPPIIEKMASIEIKIKAGSATQADIILIKELESTVAQYDRDLQSQKKKRDDAWDRMVAQGC